MDASVKVRWTRRALAQLDRHATYLDAFDHDAAAHLVWRIRSAVALLSEQPAMGRAGRIPGTRELIVAPTPYVVAYRVRDDELHVLTVLHASRRPK